MNDIQTRVLSTFRQCSELIDEHALWRIVWVEAKYTVYAHFLDRQTHF